MTPEEIEKLRNLEESLWRAETRFDRDYMNRVLSPDFFEFGRSGRVYKRDETLSMTPEEIRATLPFKNFSAHLVSDNVALVTYISEVQYDQLEISNRSSLWLKTAAGWQLQFHQGTPVAVA